MVIYKLNVIMLLLVILQNNNMSFVEQWITVYSFNFFFLKQITVLWWGQVDLVATDPLGEPVLEVAVASYK